MWLGWHGYGKEGCLKTVQTALTGNSTDKISNKSKKDTRDRG
jgi:hypothetical protein